MLEAELCKKFGFFSAGDSIGNDALTNVVIGEIMSIKYFLSFFLALLLSFSAYSQSLYQLDPETGVYLRELTLIDETTGFLVGNSGTMKITKDAGSNWEPVNSPTSGTIWGSYFINDQIGWITGDNGYYAKTSDGGNTWSQLIITSDSNERITDIKFFDENKGYASGSDGHLFFTNDGGETWNERYYEASLSPIFFNSVYIKSINEVFTGAANSRIFRTTDGGVSWAEVNYVSGGEGINNFYFIGNTGYAAGGEGLILKTTNGGSSWSDISYPTDSDLRGVYFTDANVGYISGNDGILLKTTNGGSSWSVIDLGTTNTLYFLTGINSNIYTGGASGTLFSTVEPETVDITSISEARSLADNSVVGTEGVVTRVQGSYARIQDETAGIAIFNESGAFRDAITNGQIQKGDSLRIIGLLQNNKGLAEIAGELEFEVLSSGNDLPIAQEVTLNELGQNSEELESKVIRLTGIGIIETDDLLFNENVFYSSTDKFGGVSDVKIYVDAEESVDIIGSTIPDHAFTYTGILSQYDTTDNNVGGYRLIPIEGSDIVEDTEPATVTISFPESISDTVGADIEIPVTLEFDKAATFESFEFSLLYNPQVMDIYELSMDSSVIADFDTMGNRNQTGSIFFTGAGSEEVFNPGNLLTLKVKLLEPGASDLSWNSLFFNEGEPVANPVNGTVEVMDIPRKCGDVTNDGQVTNEDATWILRHGVRLTPQFPLANEDSVYADVTANGWISSYDAAQILKDVVQLDRIFNCAGIASKQAEPLIADWNWRIVEQENEVTIPLEIDISAGMLESVDLEVNIPHGYTFEGFKNKQSGWMNAINQRAGKLYISMIGLGEEERAQLGELIFSGDGSVSDFTATSNLNEVIASQIAPTSSSELPAEFKLYQNYPNPFNPKTTIRYALPEQGLVQLTIYNALGQEVAQLVNEMKPTGTYSVVWNAGDMASGVYVYKITLGNAELTRKLMLIK
ncbi:YCF48-related protein [Gracilimonas sediminicola]|uniref:YCF48-related protein n=1 Tax=Gracilimonas sediminicola TaxID=2952158 RepID=A0A9X2L359_9BACT|nr:YCF48-related protein [Gracilimonas sediminicola]MCP9291481.1 YCF48-related protein [Gracilimonas sediminicola]